MGYRNVRHNNISNDRKKNRDNRMMIILLFVMIFTTSFESYLSAIPLKIKMWDEIIVLFIFVYTLVYSKSKIEGRVFAFLLLLIIITVVGIIGNYKTHSSLSVVLLGSYSFLKPLLLFWSLMQYDFCWNDFYRLMKMFTFFLPVIFLSYVLDFITPEFRQLLGVGGVETRMGIRSLGGLFRKQTLGILWAELFFIYYLYYSPITKKLYSYSSVMIIIMSLKIKDLFGLVVGCFTLFFKRIYAVYMALGLLLIYFLFNLYAIMMPQHYENYFGETDDSGTARTVLYLTSLELASDYFPFGVGFGKFASPVSRDMQSEIYHQYGIDTVYGLTFNYLENPSDHNFMCDTFWPMILGETGVLGLICYLLILYYAFSPLLWKYFNNTHDRTVLFPSVLFIMFMMVTIGKPVLMGPPHSLALWGLTGIFYSLKDKPIFLIR